MRKIPAVIGLVLVYLLLAGCSPPANGDGAADFLLVNGYVDEVIPAIGDAMLDLTGWFRDPLDEERIEWLGEGKKELASIQKRHLGKKFPSFEEMETWTVPVTRGEEKWVIEGRVLAPAVRELIAATDSLIDALNTIIDAEGKLGRPVKEEVERMVAEADGAVNAIREILRM